MAPRWSSNEPICRSYDHACPSIIPCLIMCIVSGHGLLLSAVGGQLGCRDISKENFYDVSVFDHHTLINDMWRHCYQVVSFWCENAAICCMYSEILVALMNNTFYSIIYGFNLPNSYTKNVNLYCCFRQDGSDQSSDKLFITSGRFFFLNTTVIRNV